jgi:hypothetical protein
LDKTKFVFLRKSMGYLKRVWEYFLEDRCFAPVAEPALGNPRKLSGLGR